jgi:hypothetical protein
MNDSRYRSGRTSRFVERFSEIPTSNQIPEAFQEFAHMNRRPMKIKKALREYSNGDDAAGQNGPHQ